VAVSTPVLRFSLRSSLQPWGQQLWASSLTGQAQHFRFTLSCSERERPFRSWCRLFSAWTSLQLYGHLCAQAYTLLRSGCTQDSAQSTRCRWLCHTRSNLDLQSLEIVCLHTFWLPPAWKRLYSLRVSSSWSWQPNCCSCFSALLQGLKMSCTHSYFAPPRLISSWLHYEALISNFWLSIHVQSGRGAPLWRVF